MIYLEIFYLCSGNDREWVNFMFKEKRQHLHSVEKLKCIFLKKRVFVVLTWKILHGASLFNLERPSCGRTKNGYIWIFFASHAADRCVDYSSKFSQQQNINRFVNQFVNADTSHGPFPYPAPSLDQVRTLKLVRVVNVDKHLVV